MIAFISGVLEFNNGENIVVDCNGVGYNIAVPLSVSERLPKLGSHVRIYTYMSVREDAVKLYGFNDTSEQDIFKKLIAVNGVGPKAAIGILSVLNPDDVRFAVLSDDVNAIAKAPGIGKKTASKIILELKDKLDLMESFELKSKHRAIAAGSSKNDAVLALTALGYSQSDAYAAVSSLDIDDEMSDTDILKLALKNI